MGARACGCLCLWFSCLCVRVRACSCCVATPCFSLGVAFSLDMQVNIRSCSCLLALGWVEVVRRSFLRMYVAVLAVMFGAHAAVSVGFARARMRWVIVGLSCSCLCLSVSRPLFSLVAVVCCWSLLLPFFCLFPPPLSSLLLLSLSLSLSALFLVLLRLRALPSCCLSLFTFCLAYFLDLICFVLLCLFAYLASLLLACPGVYCVNLCFSCFLFVSWACTRFA